MIKHHYFWSTNISIKVLERILFAADEKGIKSHGSNYAKSVIDSYETIVFSNLDFNKKQINYHPVWSGQVCLITWNLVFLANISGHVTGYWSIGTQYLLEMLQKKQLAGQLHNLPEISVFFQDKDFMKSVMFYILSDKKTSEVKYTKSLYHTPDKSILYQEI